MLTHPDTLLDLCRLWPLIRHEGSVQPPSICTDPRFTHYFHKDGLGRSLDMDALNYVNAQQKMFHYEREKDKKRHFVPVRYGDRIGHQGFIGSVQYTGRSISLVGILGGIIFILLMIACATCIKHRKRYPSEQRHQDRLARQMIVDHIRHVTQARSGQSLLAGLPGIHNVNRGLDKPPDYDTVVKVTEEDGELPSYMEAMEGAVEMQEVVVHGLQCIKEEEEHNEGGEEAGAHEDETMSLSPLGAVSLREQSVPTLTLKGQSEGGPSSRADHSEETMSLREQSEETIV
jgi:hypothetical protein